MLKTTYGLIKRLESDIGNGAHIRLSADENTLIFRVDWWDDDFHAIYHYCTELAPITDDNSFLNYLVTHFQKGYANKRRAT